jgi:Rho-binding antiterminator
MATDYQPIACGFYDELEAVATRKKQVYLQYFNDLRQLCQGSTTIKTFFTRDHAEFAQLASGEEVRLDHIIRIDDRAAPGFAEYPDFRCGC